MVESEEELKRLLMKVKKGEWKSWLKTQHSKNNIIASGPNHSWHISLFQFSLSAVSHSATPWTAVRQASLSITAPGAHSNSCPLSRWCHRPSHSLSSPSPPAFNHSQHQDLCKWVSIGVSASTSVLAMNIQGPFPLGWTGWISLLAKYSQESSPTPQFKSINSLVLSFLYSPTLTSIHDYWNNHSFD